MKGNKVVRESMGLNVETETHGMKVRAENHGHRVPPEVMGFESNVLRPTTPIGNADSYWVWGDGEWVEWGDGEVIEQ